MRKPVLFMMLVISMQFLSAQKSIVLEKFRCFSATGQIMNYFKDTVISQAIAGNLSRTLTQFHQLPLAETNTLTNIEYLSGTDNLVPLDITFSDPANAQLHLYIDVFEVAPGTFFAYSDNIPTDTSLRSRAKSVFLIKASLLKGDRTVAFSEQLNVVVSWAETLGMGMPYSYTSADGSLFQIVTTPKSFVELVRSATNILLNPANQFEMVEMKVSPAFFGDNFIIPNVMNQPRNFVTTVKNISSYVYGSDREMIRLSEPVYEEILIKGKKPQKYPDDITAAIRSAINYANSDFVFLREECRDVVRDKNYLLKLTTQVEPNHMLLQPYTFTNFLTGKFHYLLQEKDTIARFNILKRIPEEGKKIYYNMVSNGSDTSYFPLNTTAVRGTTISCKYIATGTIGSRKFSVKCSGAGNLHTIKEFLLDGKLVCIAQGRFSPEKFVVLDASLSPELLNQLFMIGFNRFFE